MNWRPVVLALAAIGLVAVIYYGIKKSSSLPEGYSFEARQESAGGTTAPPSVGTGQPAAPPLKTIAAKPGGVGEDSEEKPFTYSSKKLRNPMAPLLAKPDKTVAPRGSGQPKPAPTVRHRLEGIIWSDVRPYAIIDGNAMGIGEKLRDGSSVAEIGKDFVVLKRGGATSRLVLK